MLLYFMYITQVDWSPVTKRISLGINKVFLILILILKDPEVQS